MREVEMEVKKKKEEKRERYDAIWSVRVSISQLINEKLCHEHDLYSKL